MDKERANAERLLEIYRGNLQRFLEQKARFGGIEVPIALENQIDDARAQIATYEPFAPPQKALNAAQSVSGSIDLTTLYIQGTQIAAEQARQADQNKEIINQQVRDALWRLQAKEVIDEVVLRVDAAEKRADEREKRGDERYENEKNIRAQRQKEHDERMTGMEQSIEASGAWPAVRMLVAVLVLGMAISGILYWVVLR